MSLSPSLFIALAIRAMLAEVERGQEGPFARYHDDPVAFFDEVLGRPLWSKQKTIARAVASDPRVSVRSGNGVGKTFLAAGLALWWWATRGPGCRVFLTAPKKEQAEQAVWREIRKLYLGAKVPLGGGLPKLGTTGLQGPEEQQIVVISADTAEAMSGMRSPDMMVISDEASGIDDRLFVALEGMMSGGAKFFLISNPTKSAGYFYQSQKLGSDFTRFHISCLESPNVVENRVVIRGLTLPGWPEERARAWGVDSAWYVQRVLGNFVENEEGKLFPIGMVLAAKELWASTPATGRLAIGVDPAGDGVDGDDSAFVARRGMKVWPPIRLAGISPDAHVAHVLGLIAKYHEPGQDPPRVILDREGPTGAKVYAAFLVYLGQNEGAFELVGVRSSEHAKRRPFEINRLRDEIWFSLVDRFREGLAIPEDGKLDGDLDAIRFQKMNAQGRAEVQPKTVIRRNLGRSPDTGDALSLAMYEPHDASAAIEAQLRASDAETQRQADVYENRAERSIDPYGGVAGDPYEGSPGGRGWRGGRGDDD